MHRSSLVARAAGILSVALVVACVDLVQSTPPCPEELTPCGDACVDTRFDPSHCGACGSACAEGQACSLGQCAGGCLGATTMCQDGCVDPKGDRNHCGECDHACQAGEICSEGQCALDCGGGATKCGEACVDTTANAKHCGGCDLACAEGQVCVEGVCQLYCGAGATNCGTSCANVAQDPAHCGACGKVCESGPNAVGICAGASCELVCLPGFGNCNAASGDGCEINTKVSSLHCGGCGLPCPAIQNGSGGCTDGACKVSSCNAGFGNCDNVGATGCEVNLNTTAAHCGMCNKACPVGQLCSGGTCVMESLYSSSFTQNVGSTAAQCNDWNAFRASLVGKTFSTVKLRGSNDAVGVTCPTANLATQICQGLGAGTAVSVFCDGRNWSVGDCGVDHNGKAAVEVNANGNMCSCSAGYTARPCIDVPNNPNWGGMNTTTCTAPSQTLEVVCGS